MLGPVLFILYVNDIVDCIVPGITVKLFADDTKLYSAFDALNYSRLFAVVFISNK